MAWTALIVAGLFEVVWAYAMKQSDGFTRFWPSLITLLTMTVSVALLSYAMRSLPLGTAYVIWIGIGAIGAFAAGIVLLDEPATAFRLASAGIIVIGLVGLKLAS